MPFANFTIKGHNNTFHIAAPVMNFVIEGHNNIIFLDPRLGDDLSQAVLSNLFIMGHNNKIKKIKVLNLMCTGHNNVFEALMLEQHKDQGFNNKFYECKNRANNANNNQRQ